MEPFTVRGMQENSKRLLARSLPGQGHALGRECPGSLRHLTGCVAILNGKVTACGLILEGRGISRTALENSTPVCMRDAVLNTLSLRARNGPLGIEFLISFGQLQNQNRISSRSPVRSGKLRHTAGDLLGSCTLFRSRRKEEKTMNLIKYLCLAGTLALTASARGRSPGHGLHVSAVLLELASLSPAELLLPFLLLQTYAHLRRLPTPLCHLLPATTPVRVLL